mgnify:CR=1 FL=1
MGKLSNFFSSKDKKKLEDGLANTKKSFLSRLGTAVVGKTKIDEDVLDELEAAGLIEWSKNGVPRKKIYPEDFTTKRVQVIWEFKDKPNPIYPTEKNLNLLSRIIQKSLTSYIFRLRAFIHFIGNSPQDDFIAHFMQVARSQFLKIILCFLEKCITL